MVEDGEEDSKKRVRIVGSDEKGVAAAVADIRALAGPAPLLSGVPLSQAVYDKYVAGVFVEVLLCLLVQARHLMAWLHVVTLWCRLKALDSAAPVPVSGDSSFSLGVTPKGTAPGIISMSRGDGERLRALGSHTEADAAAWAAERWAATIAARSEHIKCKGGVGDVAGSSTSAHSSDSEIETSWNDGELTTLQVSKWTTEDVQRWVRFCAGVPVGEAVKVPLDGAELLAMPLYPTTQLEEVLLRACVSSDAVKAITTAYMEQRWTITTEVGLLGSFVIWE
jgi:hypothetical protein